jgi:hypothetical protein
MLAGLNDMTPNCRLRPFYEPGSLGELIQRAGERTPGILRATLLRDSASRVAGWYLFHFVRGGLAEVLQIASREDCRQQVVAHMATDARKLGAIAAVSRLEPGMAAPLANQFCLLFRRKHLMLIHSRFPDILDAIHSGQAFISRLEGEWCLRFA